MTPFSQLSSLDFAAAVQKLLPRGRAWSRRPDSALTGLCAAVGDCLATVHANMVLFLDRESDPAQAVALLGNWETDFGLPDACSPSGPVTTNLLPYSVPTPAKWGSGYHVTCTANAALAPDGTMTAESVVPDTTTNNVHFQTTPVTAITAGAPVYGCGFFKANGYPRVYVALFDPSWVSGVYATFNLTTGNIDIPAAPNRAATSPLAFIQYYGNGWWRCGLSCVLSTYTSATLIPVVDNGSGHIFTGDGTSGILQWGAQIGEGAFWNYYIGTNGAPATGAPAVFPHSPVQIPPGQTVTQRQAALLAKIAASPGGQSAAYFESVAAALGYNVSITTWQTFQLTGGAPFWSPLVTAPWRFAWRVNAPKSLLGRFTLGQSELGEPFWALATTDLECRFRKIAPAYGTLWFNYS